MPISIAPPLAATLPISEANVTNLTTDLAAKTPLTTINLATKNLTSANLLALNTTPVQVIAAPTAGTAIVPICAAMVGFFNTTAYADLVNFFLIYHGTAKTGQSALLTLNPDGLGQTANTISMQATAQGDAFNATVFDATALDIAAQTNDPTTGDGTARVLVWYSLVSVT